MLKKNNITNFAKISLFVAIVPWLFLLSMWTLGIPGVGLGSPFGALVAISIMLGPPLSLILSIIAIVNESRKIGITALCVSIISCAFWLVPMLH